MEREREREKELKVNIHDIQPMHEENVHLIISRV